MQQWELAGSVVDQGGDPCHGRFQGNCDVLIDFTLPANMRRSILKAVWAQYCSTALIFISTFMIRCMLVAG